ncbi:MAG: hypothetical protein ACP5OG_02720, partial [Candidatus Nanoarchaeia archaeon]
KIGALEAVSKYLKENLNLSYKEIGELLKRDQKTIWTSYNKAKEKYPDAIKPEETKYNLPIAVINNKLTILESTVLYLKEQKLKYSQIALITKRDQRNVWSIYSKAKEKINN